MKLSFLAREDSLVREAGIAPQIGQPARYYGRTFDSTARSYPATKEGFECEDGTEDAEKCARQVRKGTLFAGNRKTAEAIGVPFVETEWKDGVYVAKGPRTRASAEESS